MFPILPTCNAFHAKKGRRRWAAKRPAHHANLVRTIAFSQCCSRPVKAAFCLGLQGYFQWESGKIGCIACSMLGNVYQDQQAQTGCKLCANHTQLYAGVIEAANKSVCQCKEGIYLTRKQSGFRMSTLHNHNLGIDAFRRRLCRVLQRTGRKWGGRQQLASVAIWASHPKLRQPDRPTPTPAHRRRHYCRRVRRVPRVPNALGRQLDRRLKEASLNTKPTNETRHCQLPAL